MRCSIAAVVVWGSKTFNCACGYGKGSFTSLAGSPLLRFGSLDTAPRFDLPFELVLRSSRARATEDDATDTRARCCSARPVRWSVLHFR